MVLPANRMNAQQQSAFGIIQETLRSYGLESLIGFVQNYITRSDEVDPNQLMVELRTQPAYQQRFSANEARRRAGLPVLSEGEYIAMERQYAQLMRASGMPADFYDSPSDFQRFLENDVSLNEMNQRIQSGYEAVRMANPEVINQMKRLYGVQEGELAAYFLDPKRAAPILVQRAQAAQIAAQGRLQAGMDITAKQAEQLAQAGISGEQATEGFAAIKEAQGLFQATTQEQQAEGEKAAFTQTQQIGAVFGTNAAAAQRLRQRARRRQTEFERGGGFATGEAGAVTGVQ